jgi:type II secretory pathway pseudopilin PulG
MKKNGFTILEMIVAIFIMNIGIAAIFSVVAQSTSYVNLSSSKLTAMYLAQEGIETVRNIRDGNLLSMAKTGIGTWTNNLSMGSDYYNFDYRSQSIPDNTNCVGKNYLQVSGDFYLCSSVSSDFQRKVRLNQVGTDKLEVTVSVSWIDKGITRSVSVSEILYKWY